MTANPLVLQEMNASNFDTTVRSFLSEILSHFLKSLFFKGYAGDWQMSLDYF